VKIRTAIFGVYVAASALGFAVWMTLVLRDVRTRYVESMRRTMGDTAAFLAVFAAEDEATSEAWARRLATLPPKADLLRVFASDPVGRVLFDSAGGQDVGQVYVWDMRGGGPLASENYTLNNVAEVGDELRVRAPVRIGGQLRGWVGVGRRLATISDGVRQARSQLIIYGFTIAAIMVAAGWWIASRLTHSLERLTAYAIAVREGRPAEPPASRAAEISALSRAFEEMRVTLEGKAHVERYTQALAHEFKAPLSAIRGAAELLGEDMPRADRARFIGNLRAESDRLQLIVERLLELAALEARREAPPRVNVDVSRVVADTVAEAETVATARKITLHLAAAEAVLVTGDKFLLEQAVSNLLQNALQFTPGGGAVTVSVTSTGDRALVKVEDSGPGVPAYALEKVFERFYSLPRPDTGRKSSGLGLSIVREIARLHGGEVSLENRPEGGACALLSLPLVTAKIA
jgi:two-component system, OmpR family, sensor histidine kinase CreC